MLSLRVHLAQVREREIQAASGVEVASAQLNWLMGRRLDRELALAEPAPAAPGVPLTREAERAAMRPPGGEAGGPPALACRNARKRARGLPSQLGTGLYESAAARSPTCLLVDGCRAGALEPVRRRRRPARLRAATAAAARAGAERRAQRNRAASQAWTTRAQLEAALAREEVGRSAVLQARESQRIIRDRYEAGLAPVTDVLRAANALLDAETLRISTIVDVMVAWAALERSTGRVPSGR